ELDVRDERRLDGCPQLRVDDDDGDHVGEESECQVLEAAKDDRVRELELHHPDEEGSGNEKPRGLHMAAGQQGSSGGDRAEVSTDIDGVRTEDQEDAGTDENRREFPAK